MNKVQELTKKGLITPPAWLPENVMYLTIMGSVAYGVSTDDSDFDVYGFAIPKKDMVFPHLSGEILGFGRQIKRFEQYQQHHIWAEDELGGKGRNYDITVYSIVKFFQLVMENNPNMVDSLFTPARCVLTRTPIWEMVRQNRELFLHRGCFHKFRGYAYSQLHKMETKNPEGKRKALVEKYGYDCYDKENTEFLTDSGWKFYDDISPLDKIATINIETNEIELQKYTNRIEKKHTGILYDVNSRLSRFIITENHNLLLSPAHRGINGYSYDESVANWQLIKYHDIISKKTNRSWFHIRRRGKERRQERFEIKDGYLALAGLFLSDGTLQFRKQKPKVAIISQTDNGKFSEVESSILYIEQSLGVESRVYVHETETRWVFPRRIAEKLYADFGHGTKAKRLPKWCFSLSFRQSYVLWNNLFLGDGTRAKNNGEVLYTSNKKLADDIHAMLTLSGHLASVRGPYKTETTYGTVEMYQVYRPYDQSSVICVGLRNRPNIKKTKTKNRIVVCFEVPNGTLITRCRGNVAIQGNCKFAYHTIRLSLECEQILEEHTLDLERNREILKSVRRGEWSARQIREWFAQKEKHLDDLYHNSTLPHSPREDEIKELLLNCLEHHYGKLPVVVPGRERKALLKIQEIVNGVI